MEAIMRAVAEHDPSAAASRSAWPARGVPEVDGADIASA
jgi:hypothetical protein